MASFEQSIDSLNSRFKIPRPISTLLTSPEDEAIFTAKFTTKFDPNFNTVLAPSPRGAG